MLDDRMARRAGVARAADRPDGRSGGVLAILVAAGLALSTASVAQAQRNASARPNQPSPASPQPVDDAAVAAAQADLITRDAELMKSIQAAAVAGWERYMQQVALKGTESELPEAFLERQRDSAYQELINAFPDTPLPDVDALEAMGVGGIHTLDLDQPGAVNGAGRRPGDIQLPRAGDNPLEGVLADAQGMVQLNFTDAVELLAFTDFIARALHVNIFVVPDLEGQTVIFQAPHKVHVDELIPLLSKLLEERGFTITYNADLEFYSIRRFDDVFPTVPGGESLATTRIVSTPMIMASTLVNPIQQLLPANLQPQIRLSPIDDLNIMMVSGPPSLVSVVEGYINEILSITEQQVFTTIDLVNVSSEYALEQILYLNGEPAEPTAGFRSANVRGRSNSRTPTVGAAPGAASITATSGSLVNLADKLTIGPGNSLVFRGTREEAAMVEQLIAQIDKISRLEARLYRSSTQVAQKIAELGVAIGLGSVIYTEDLGSTNQFGSGRSSSAAFPQGNRGASGVEEPPASSGSKFIIDLGNGDITYFGTPSQHQLVAQLVTEFLATVTQNETIIEAYKLDNADAEKVAELLTQLIEDPALASQNSAFFGGGRNGAGSGDPSSDLAQLVDAGLAELSETSGLIASSSDTSIIADVDRNQILIRTRPAAQQQLARLIQLLDKRQPQVLIDVQIVSVSTSNNFNWEADFKVDIGSFSAFSGFRSGDVDGRLGEDGLLNGDLIPGAATTGLTAGVFDSDDVQFIFSALESVGDTTIMSKPFIIVNDNQEGTILSEREEPFQEISQGETTTTTGQGGTAKAGTNLTVTPQISSGGYISLEYNLILSAFVGAAQQGLQPPKQQEEYTSTVTVPSDSTIVVGGFSFVTDSDTESKIPVLGDIPILGNAFKSISKQKQRRTIFVFITPKILDSPSFEGMKTITYGPLLEAGVKGDHPPMEPQKITVERSGLERLLEANRPPSGGG